MPDKLLTTEEAAEILRVSRFTVKLWRQKKMLPFTRIGRRVFHRLSDIEKVIEEKTVQAA